MLKILKLNPLATILLLSIGVVGAGRCRCCHYGSEASDASQGVTPARMATGARKPAPDLSGRTRFGDASFYATKFAGRVMADGGKMDPRGDNAASKRFPWVPRRG